MKTYRLIMTAAAMLAAAKVYSCENTQLTQVIKLEQCGVQSKLKIQAIHPCNKEKDGSQAQNSLAGRGAMAADEIIPGKRRSCRDAR